MCLVEGTNLSEGRGTTRPFERAGAPWLDARALAAQLAGWDLPGVIFRPVRVVPEFPRHAGAERQGVQLHVAGRLAFRPVLAGGPGWREAIKTGTSPSVIAAARASAEGEIARTRLPFLLDRSRPFLTVP